MAQNRIIDPFAEDIVADVEAKEKQTSPTPTSPRVVDPFAGESPAIEYKTAPQAAQEAVQEKEPEESFNFANYLDETREAVGEIASYQEGLRETLMAMGSGMVSSTVGGLAGLGAVSQGYSSQQATDLIERVQQDYTYTPKSEEGKKILQAASKPFELWGEFTDYMADRQYESTGSPLVGATYKTAYEAIPAVVGLKPVVKPVQMGTTTARTAGKVVQKVVSKRAKEAAIKEGAIKQLKKDIDELAPLQTEAAKVERIKKDIPGYDPTLAETTGSRALASRQRELDVETPQTIQKVWNRRKSNVEAIQNFLKESFGKQTPKIHKVFTEARGGIDKALTKLDERIADVRARRNALADSETVSQAAVGKRLRQLVDEEYQIAKAKGAALYNRIGNTDVNMQRVYAKVDDIINNEMQGWDSRDVPDVFKKISSKHQELQAKVAADPITGKKSVPVQSYISTFDDVRAVDKQLGEAIASEKAAFRPDNNRIRLLTETKQEVQKTMDSLELSGDAQVAAAYKQARDFWREEVANKYYSGLGKRIRDQKYGEWNIADEKLIDEIFSPAKMKTGGTKAAREFKAIYGENPEAMAQLNLGVMQKFRDYPGLIKDGVLDPRRVTAFKEKYRDVLAEFPTIARQIDDVEASNTALADLQNVLIAKKSRIEKTALARALNTEDYSTIVETAIKNPEIMRRMSLAIKSQEAKRGLSKAISDYAIRETTRRNPNLDGLEYIDSTAMYDFLRKNRQSLVVGMEPGHLKALTEAYDALRILDRVKLPKEAKARQGIGQRFTEAVGNSFRSILNMARARQQGRTSTTDISTVIAGGFINKLYMKKIMGLERAAHYDMDAAKVLRDLAKADNLTPALEKRMNDVFFKIGLGAEIAAVDSSENTRAAKEKAVRKKSGDFTYEMLKGVNQ